MGCGSSCDVGDLRSPNQQISLTQKNEEFNTSKPVVDEKIQSRQVHEVMSRQQTRLQIKESSQDTKISIKDGAFDLPEGEFLNGMLGLTIDDEKIQQIVSNMKEGELFTDFEFPTETALCYTDDKKIDDVIWVRPKDMVPEPVLFLNGASRHDIAQGILGDCWFLSPCAAVAGRTDLLQRVVPPNQPLHGDGYRGIVQFRFWRFGNWVKVYIDDQLPTQEGRLIYARCSDPNEFWVALLEKAYAKLHGSYEAIEGGQTMDALVDLTGGLAERYDIADTDTTTIYEQLLQASKWGAFITCSRKGDWREATGADQSGLVAGHAYTITNVKKIKTDESWINLLRIRNPWGDETEWNGQWSDESQAWGTVNDSVKEKLNYKNQGDGEFWMNFDDFCREFEEVSVCTLGPDFDKDGKVDKPTQVKAIKGSWVTFKTSGGSRNDFLKFATNPQFHLSLSANPDTLMEENENEIENETELETETQKCSVVIGLMQEHRRSERHKGIHMHQIGFVIYKCSDVDQRLSADYLMYNHSLGSTGTFINYREVFGRFQLEPGDYIIIPATFEPNCPANFMIRVYAVDSFQLRELPSNEE